MKRAAPAKKGTLGKKEAHKYRSKKFSPDHWKKRGEGGGLKWGRSISGCVGGREAECIKAEKFER